MTNSNKQNSDIKQPCEFCNGTGQMSYFQGESRFLLTHDECHDCNGTGLKQQEVESDSSPVQDK